MNLTHAYSKYIENAYTNSDNTGDNADVPRVTSLSSLLGSADRYKVPRVGSCKAIQDTIITLNIINAFHNFEIDLINDQNYLQKVGFHLLKFRINLKF